MPPNMSLAEIQSDNGIVFVGKKPRKAESFEKGHRRNFRRGSPKSADKIKPRVFCRSPPDTPTKYHTNTFDPDLNMGVDFHSSQVDSFGRISPSKVDGTSTSGSGNTVAGYNTVQAPAPVVLPPPPTSWMGADFEVASSMSQHDVMGILSTQLKMMLKVQG